MSDDGVMLEFKREHHVFVWVTRGGIPTCWRMDGECTVEQAQRNARYEGWEIYEAAPRVLSKAARGFIYAAQKALQGESA